MFCQKCGESLQEDTPFCAKCDTQTLKPTKMITDVDHPPLEQEIANIEKNAIWNPNAATNWSLIFSPVFGSYLHALNWRILGEQNRANSAMAWFYFSIVMLVVYIFMGMLIADERAAYDATCGLGFIYLIIWYFASGRAQAKYVKMKFGRNYQHRGWGKPLLIGVAAIVGYIFLSLLPLFIYGGEMSLFDRFFGPKKGTAAYHLQRGMNALSSEVGNFEDAVVECSKAIALDAHLVDAYYNRGLGYYFSGKFKPAIEDFDKTLELAPLSAPVKYWRVKAISGQQHEKLENQFLVLYENGEMVSRNAVDQILREIIDVLSGIKEYRSKLVVYDLQCAALKDFQYMIISWNFDFINPDSFDIHQFTRLENYPNGAEAWWGRQGQDNFTTMYLYQNLSEGLPDRTPIEKFIRIDKYLEYLKTIDLKSVHLERIANQGVYFIETELPTNIMLGSWPISQFRQQLAHNLYHIFVALREGNEFNFISVPIVSDQVDPHSIGVNPDLVIVPENLKLVLKLWSNTSDYYPVKAQIEIDGYLENGEKISFVIEQGFIDFNNNVQIITPPL